MYFISNKEMKKILDVGFGRKTLYELCKSSQMSSRIQYGLTQLEDKYIIEHISWHQFNFKGLIWNNMIVLKKCDVVYVTYLYVKPIIVLALLKRIGLYRKRKLIAISHISLRDGKNRLESFFLRFVYGAVDKMLFHSQINMEESIRDGLINRESCDFLYWGDDLNYVDSHLSVRKGSIFLSTGREHRDFYTIISAFSKMPHVPLSIYTNLHSYDSNYEYMLSEKGKYDNIDVEFVEKSPETTKYLAKMASECRCVVISLEKERIVYCIGFTSVVEAMAMSKPIISTRNPYYPIDLEKEGIGLYVEDEDSWKKAVDFICSNPEIAEAMGKRGRKLAEEKFNIIECSKQIERIINM